MGMGTLACLCLGGRSGPRQGTAVLHRPDFVALGQAVMAAWCCQQITELSKEVFKLKEALNGLSELPTKAGALPKAQQGQLEAGVLQGRIKALEEQLTVSTQGHLEPRGWGGMEGGRPPSHSCHLWAPGAWQSHVGCRLDSWLKPAC